MTQAIPALSAGDVFQLEQQDCIKCHVTQQQQISNFGGQHGTAVGCLDCHPQHPPTGTEFTIGCNACHSDLPHYQLPDCLHCHRNPHQPMVSLRDPIKPVRDECVSCHVEVGEQMQAEPSRHAELFCNRCHSRHKEIPGCLDCHEPHAANQVSADCLRCHPAHQPLVIKPSGYLPSVACRPCHVSQSNALTATNTNHAGINCTYCHAGRHPARAKCQTCHGLPHAQSIHSQFRNCLDCHGDAHNLISNR